jgi:hypothetical protein
MLSFPRTSDVFPLTFFTLRERSDLEILEYMEEATKQMKPIEKLSLNFRLLVSGSNILQNYSHWLLKILAVRFSGSEKFKDQKKFFSLFACFRKKFEKVFFSLIDEFSQDGSYFTGAVRIKVCKCECISKQETHFNRFQTSLHLASPRCCLVNVGRGADGSKVRHFFTSKKNALPQFCGIQLLLP